MSSNSDDPFANLLVKLRLPHNPCFMSNNLRAMIDAIMNNQNDMINQNDDDNRYIKELKIGKTRSRIATKKSIFNLFCSSNI